MKRSQKVHGEAKAEDDLPTWMSAAGIADPKTDKSSLI